MAHPVQNHARPIVADETRIPLWRRITALFTLSSMVVLGGLILAGMITLAILMVLYLMEQAIA